MWYENHHLQAGDHTIEIQKIGGNRLIIDDLVIYRKAVKRIDTNIFQIKKIIELDLSIQSHAGSVIIDGSDIIQFY